MSFQQLKYQVIKNAIPYELANFCFNYFLLKRDAVDFMYNRNIVAESSLLGTRKDPQVPGVYSHYGPWAIYLEGVQVDLAPGDMLVYSGCDLEHWRDEFQGNICGQVFLHYNHRNGQFAEQNKFDKRAMLGLPSGINM